MRSWTNITIKALRGSPRIPTKYDSYSRSGPKVFIGEYAVAYSIPPATFAATLQNAIGEAAWMTGMERNSDIVAMGCYAPLFCNLNNPSWYPDLIYFNGTNAFGAPSYYVQQMFSLNQGNVVLPTTVAVSGNPLYVSSSLVQSSGRSSSKLSISTTAACRQPST